MNFLLELRVGLFVCVPYCARACGCVRRCVCVCVCHKPAIRSPSRPDLHSLLSSPLMGIVLLCDELRLRHLHLAEGLRRWSAPEKGEDLLLKIHSENIHVKVITEEWLSVRHGIFFFDRLSFVMYILMNTIWCNASTVTCIMGIFHLTSVNKLVFRWVIEAPNSTVFN